jgi:hypothetical protein
MSTRTRFRAATLACAIGFTALGARAAPDADSQDDPALAQYRERFKQGLDRYEASDVAGALSYWEPLYRDLGPSRGYRVGYNLARAYEVVGDMTRAAERYQTFLDEVKDRRASGKPVDDDVAADETKARARLDDIARTRARIRVPPTSPPESVRVDQSEPRLAGFVAYVAPGGHDVVFAPGTSHAHEEHVDVRAGQLLEIVAPKIDEPKPFTSPRVTSWTDAVHRPFSPTWLWVAGIATIVGGGATAGAYANAIIVHDHYVSQPPSQGPTQAQVIDYENARTVAYASWAIPASFALVTTVLAVVYAARTHHVKVPELAFVF